MTLIRPVADGIYQTGAEGVRLVGARHRESGRIVFPRPSGHVGEAYEPELLPSSGHLWSWTVQRFQPKTPYAGPGEGSDFEPFAVGYVELGDEIIVEGILDTQDFASLRVGMPMELCERIFRQDSANERIGIYAFRPVS